MEQQNAERAADQERAEELKASTAIFDPYHTGADPYCPRGTCSD